MLEEKVDTELENNQLKTKKEARAHKFIISRHNIKTPPDTKLNMQIILFVQANGIIDKTLHQFAYVSVFHISGAQEFFRADQSSK